MEGVHWKHYKGLVFSSVQYNTYLNVRWNPITLHKRRIKINKGTLMTIHILFETVYTCS